MRNTLLFLCSLSFSLSIISCQWQPQPTATETVEIDSRVPRYTIQQELYDAASPEETSVEISIPELRATLLNGENQVIFETDISTGIDGRETPTGTFRVLERIVDKRSNKYGQYVRKDTREVIVKKAWEHSGKIPEGCVYQGIAMPYWMRLTWYGVGMHVGKFERGKRSSFGCIRVPEAAQPFIYNKTKLGTKITITR